MIALELSREIERYAVTLETHPLLVAAEQARVTPEIVGRYLASILYLISHTEPHLERARAGAESRAQLELERFFRAKLPEEYGHDGWAKSDLAVLGQRFGLKVDLTPASAIVDLVGELETIILNEPAAYLPYVLFAEYLTVLVGPRWVRALEEHCGVPPAALSVVSHHTELDREHVAEALRELDALLEGVSRELLFATLAVAERSFDAFCAELAAYAAAA
jgi:hypothetical protein